MIRQEFQGDSLPALGFGAMRLPTLTGEEIDVARVEEMVEYAMANGVNYFDTAMPYHAGMSEVVMGRLLSKYPRESFYLATKYPGHQVCSSYDPAATFEQQMRKCGVEYFDYYLLHNVSESTVGTYEDERWGIIPYFLEQKRLGRIRHLGFSTHGRLGMLRAFLERHGKEMDFCQIQLNYLDWSLQYAKEKVDLLEEFGLPVWVMEPVRGGKLAKLDEDFEARMKQLRPEESVAAWSFRFLQGLPQVKMILSGMSNMDQVRDNVCTFQSHKPLNEQEQALVFEVADRLKNVVPCTRCRYCCEGCPKGLDIPTLLGILNELRFSDSVNTAMMMEFAPEEQKPTACIACGKCVRSCPQNIDIPGALKELTEKLKTIPSWAALSKLREEEMQRSLESIK